ncbi:MAG: hypothetical protein WCL07_04020 [bacterium]
MLSISHAATGAFIAVKLGNPYLAIPLILLSHYVEDAIPHWDVGTGLTSGSKSARSALIGEVPDLLLAGILVLAMYPSSIPQIHDAKFQILSLSPIWGAFIGLLPDFLEAPRNFLKKEPCLLKPINYFHHIFHHSIPRPLDGLIPQILLVILLWYFR